MGISEEDVWDSISPEDMWVLDKLILSRHMGYVCGPIGTDVPKPSHYIVRPCVNALGLGLGTSIKYLTKNTDKLPLGFFWCEIFKGRHLSVDYLNGEQILCVEGFKDSNTFTKWDWWSKTNDVIPLPSFLSDFSMVNCEYIDGNLIEVHFRHNPDFVDGITEFIPVWEGQDIIPPIGYKYKEYPDVHGRVGCFYKK